MVRTTRRLDTPRLDLWADRVGNAIAFVVWGGCRLVLAGLLGSFAVLAFREGQPAMALFLLPLLPLLLHLLWMGDAGLAVSNFYGRCIGWLWRLIVPAPLRQSGRDYLELRREARAKARAKAEARGLAVPATTTGEVGSVILGMGRLIYAAALTVGGIALVLLLAFLVFQLLAAMPVSIAIILGAIIIAAALLLR